MQNAFVIVATCMLTACLWTAPTASADERPADTDWTAAAKAMDRSPNSLREPVSPQGHEVENALGDPPPEDYNIDVGTGWGDHTHNFNHGGSR